MMESTGSSERTCLQQHHHQHQLQQQQQHGTSSGNLLPPGLQSGGVLYTLESQNDFGKVGPGSGVRAAAGDGTHRAATGLKRARDQKNDHSSSGQRKLLCSTIFGMLTNLSNVDSLNRSELIEPVSPRQHSWASLFIISTTQLEMHLLEEPDLGHSIVKGNSVNIERKRKSCTLRDSNLQPPHFKVCTPTQCYNHGPCIVDVI